MNIAQGALQANQLAMQTISHNMANMNTPGYTSQKAVLESQVPYAQDRSATIAARLDSPAAVEGRLNAQIADIGARQNRVEVKDREALQLEDSCEGVKTLVIVNIVPGEPIKITANCLDPVLVNTKKDWPNKLPYTDLHTRPGFPSPRWINRNSTPEAESLDEKGLSRSPVLDFSFWSIFSNPD